MEPLLKRIAVPLVLVAVSGAGCLALMGGQGTSLSSAAATAAPAGLPDLTQIGIGDGKSTTSGAKRGYLYVCNTSTGPSGAMTDGPWIHGSTYDLTAKYKVDGDVRWPQAVFTAKLKKTLLKLSGNGLPADSGTGVFPIAAGDDAYQVDRNPNSIKATALAKTLSRRPKKASRPGCTSGGQIGVMTNGVALFNAVDAGGKDAVAHEVQDSCSGHPQQQGQYHYHGLPACMNTGAAGKQSKQIGWAFDGFPIYGPRGKNGSYLSNAKLDACHGTTTKVKYLGKTMRIYHYVANYEFPYTLGCFHGTAKVSSTAPSGPPQGGPPAG
jgi:YHYH protein